MTSPTLALANLGRMAHEKFAEDAIIEYQAIVLGRLAALEAVAEAARALYEGQRKFREEEVVEGEVPSSEDIYNFARVIMDYIPGLRDALNVLDKEEAR